MMNIYIQTHKMEITHVKIIQIESSNISNIIFDDDTTSPKSKENWIMIYKGYTESIMSCMINKSTPTVIY